MHKTVLFCSENSSIILCSREKRYQALLTLLCARSTTTMTATSFCNRNGSFTERVLWISGACVETRPRGNEATCIVSGDRMTSHKLILHTLQKDMTAELNQSLAKKHDDTQKALHTMFKHYLCKNLSLPFLPSSLPHPSFLPTSLLLFIPVPLSLSFLLLSSQS